MATERVNVAKKESKPSQSQRMSRKEVEQIVRKYARNEEEVRLMMAIIANESGFDPRATRLNKNGTYDYGLAQINSSNFKALGIKNPEELYDPETNVKHAFTILRESRRMFESHIGKNNVSTILGVKFYASFNSPENWGHVEKIMKDSGIPYTKEEMAEAKRLWSIYKERYEPKKQFSAFLKDIRAGAIETSARQKGVSVAQAGMVGTDAVLKTAVKEKQARSVVRDNSELGKLEVLTGVMERLPHGVVIDMGNGVWVSRQGMVLRNGEQVVKVRAEEVNALGAKEREVLKSKLKELNTGKLEALEKHTEMLRNMDYKNASLIVDVEGKAKPVPVHPFVDAGRLPMQNGNVQEYVQRVVEDLNKRNGKKVKVEVVDGVGITYSYQDSKITVGRNTPKDMLTAGLFQAYAMALTEGYAYAYGKDSSITQAIADKVARELVVRAHGENGLYAYERGLKEYEKFAPIPEDSDATPIKLQKRGQNNSLSDRVRRFFEGLRTRDSGIDNSYSNDYPNYNEPVNSTASEKGPRTNNNSVDDFYSNEYPSYDEPSSYTANKQRPQDKEQGSGLGDKVKRFFERLRTNDSGYDDFYIGDFPQYNDSGNRIGNERGRISNTSYDDFHSSDYPSYDEHEKKETVKRTVKMKR